MIKRSRIFRVLGSTKFAMIVLSLYVVLMIYGTLLESSHGAPYANAAIYHSSMFYFVQFLIALSVLFSLLDRIPFKKRLIGFYLVHMAIITVFIGSFVTYKYGLDGNITLAPGIGNSTVVLDKNMMTISVGEYQYRYELPSTYREKELGWELDIPNLPSLKVLEYLPFAQGQILWQKEKGVWTTEWNLGNSSLNQKFRMSNILTDVSGPILNFDLMTFKIVDLDEFAELKKGLLGDDKLERFKKFRSRPHIFMAKDLKNGSEKISLLVGFQNRWQAIDYSSGPIKLPWVGLTLGLVDESIGVQPVFSYRYGKPEGKQASGLKALKVSYLYENQLIVSWITNERTKRLPYASGGFNAAIDLKKVTLPLSLTLDRFETKMNPGTKQPASYESYVKVNPGLPGLHHVFMNHPLKVSGYTFYQSSYFQERGEYHSILSVNRDPGRALKYFGTFLLVLGMIFYFVTLNRKKSKTL